MTNKGSSKGKSRKAKSNVARRTLDYWKLSTACHNPSGASGITFEEATKKIRNALQRLGPHRKVVTRFHELQHSLIVGAKKCQKTTPCSSNSSTQVSFTLLHRTQKTHTQHSQ